MNILVDGDVLRDKNYVYYCGLMYTSLYNVDLILADV